MKTNIDLNGKELKFSTAPTAAPLEGDVIINFQGYETIFPRALVFSAIRKLLDDKCLKLRSAIDHLATLLAAKPTPRLRNKSGRFVKNSIRPKLTPQVPE
jgi:hypothetical protein